MSQITKNQHFVPRFLIGNFCERGVVNVYDSKRKILRPPTSVSRVFSENYFYDRDNSVESLLAKHVEGPAAPIFEGIAKNPAQPSPYNRVDLLRFLSVQLNRTPSALSDALQIVDNFSASIIGQLCSLNNFEGDPPRLVLENPKSVLQNQTVEAILNWPLLEDLKSHVLINKSGIDFIISDHPVVHYNWYLRNSDDVAYTGLTSCGVQIFLPVSNSVMFCLYDERVYNFGGKSGDCSYVYESSDVLLLNELQFRNRNAFVAFGSSALNGYVIKSCEKFAENSLHLNNSWLSGLSSCGNNQAKSIYVGYRTQVRLDR